MEKIDSVDKFLPQDMRWAFVEPFGENTFYVEIGTGKYKAPQRKVILSPNETSFYVGNKRLDSGFFKDIPSTLDDTSDARSYIHAGMELAQAISSLGYEFFLTTIALSANSGSMYDPFADGFQIVSSHPTEPRYRVKILFNSSGAINSTVELSRRSIPKWRVHKQDHIPYEAAAYILLPHGLLKSEAAILGLGNKTPLEIKTAQGFANVLSRYGA